ncbi:hypothetical protein ACFWHT_06140 [Microbacterium sp. NPDC058342]|uniref:hypothetical protein n=1 Tax=Microbacterium sp. NPDC058342 TaxID=3346454 RepID=UPI003658FB1B
MEHRAESGALPYDPPSAAVAQAYLDESVQVAQRREERIDRRSAARLFAVEGVGLAVYTTVLFLVMPDGGVAVLALMSPMLIWSILAGSLHETYGYRRRGREQRVRGIVAAVLIACIVGGLALLVSGVELPLALRLVPGALALIAYAAVAVGEWRRGVAREALVSVRAPFDRATRIVTACIGVALGVAIASAGAPSTGLAWLSSLPVMLGLALWSAMVAAGTAPAVAPAWGPAAWTAFAAACVATVALTLLSAFTATALAVPGIVAGAVIAAGFGVIALVGRNRD